MSNSTGSSFAIASLLGNNELSSINEFDTNVAPIGKHLGKPKSVCNPETFSTFDCGCDDASEHMHARNVSDKETDDETDVEHTADDANDRDSIQNDYGQVNREQAKGKHQSLREMRASATRLIYLMNHMDLHARGEFWRMFQANHNGE